MLQNSSQGEQCIFLERKKKHSDELLSMEDEITMGNKLPYEAGRSCYLEGLLAECHTVFECAMFGMKDWQS